VRAVAVSSQRWADAEAAAADYAAAVEAILATTGINKEQAILALAPIELRAGNALSRPRW
jgi:hypothetical protein